MASRDAKPQAASLFAACGFASPILRELGAFVLPHFHPRPHSLLFFNVAGGRSYRSKLAELSGAFAWFVWSSFFWFSAPLHGAGAGPGRAGY